MLQSLSLGDRISKPVRRIHDWVQVQLGDSSWDTWDLCAQWCLWPFTSHSIVLNHEGGRVFAEYLARGLENKKRKKGYSTISKVIFLERAGFQHEILWVLQEWNLPGLSIEWIMGNAVHQGSRVCWFLSPCRGSSRTTRQQTWHSIPFHKDLVVTKTNIKMSLVLPPLKRN